MHLPCFTQGAQVLACEPIFVCLRGPNTINEGGPYAAVTRGCQISPVLDPPLLRSDNLKNCVKAEEQPTLKKGTRMPLSSSRYCGTRAGVE